MDELKKLYDVLISEGFFTKSFEVFQQEYQNESYRDKVFGVVTSEGLFTKSRDVFDSTYSFETTPEPVDVSTSAINPNAGVPEAVPEKKNPFETDPELPQEVPNELFPQPQTEGDGELPSGYSQGDTSSESYLTGGSFDATDPFAATILADDYNKDLGENVFISNVNAIVPETTSAREEGEVVGEMNYKFNQYGFEFEETGFGDNMIVKSANDQEIRIPLDAALGAGAGSRAEELRQFLIKNKEASVEAFNRASKNEQKYLNKIQNKEQLVKLNTLFNTQVDRFSDDVRNYSAEKLRLSRIYKESFAGKNADELLNNPLYQEYQEATKRLDSARTSLINKQKSFVTKGAQLDEMVGEYTLMRNTSGESGLAIERLAYSFLEGTGGAIFGELADMALSLAGKVTNFDASRDRFAADEHVDYAVAQLTNNIEGFNLDDANILTTEQADELLAIKTLLAKKELDVIDQKKLKGLLLEFNPKDLQVILENIENEDGDDIHSLTESIYEDVSTKGLGEYESTEILLSGDGIEAPEGVMYPVNVDAYEKAKSAAMGGAFSRNRYTGMASSLDLEEGTRDMFRTSVNKYLAGETDGQSAYRKAIKNSGNDIQKAMHGVAYSVPAFATWVKTGPTKAAQLTAKYGPQLGKKLLKNRKFNNKASRVLRLMSQSHEAQMNKMANNPNFDNIDLDEQRAVAIPISIVTAVLEDKGFRNVINSKGLINSLAARAISKFAKVRAVNPTAGTKTFAEFVRQDINNLMRKGVGRTLTKGGLTVLAGGAAEFETGALQSIGEQTAEMVYNTYKRNMDGIEGEMFDTADSVGEFFTEVMYQGYLEMLGGKIMAIPTAISVMGNNPDDLNMVTDEAFEMFQGMLQDPQYKNMFTTNLKQRVADKTDALTQEDADAMMETFNKIEGLMPQVVGDMTVQQQRVALSLVMERQALESEIAPLAPELAINQRARIKEITKQIEDITLIANAEQEAAMEAEQSIPDINSKSKTKTDPAVEADPDISLEEQEDIQERFGEESATSPEEQVEENLFFNRRGKSKKKLTKEQRSMRNKVINKAVNAAQSLAKSVKTKIVMHESTKEFNKATQRNGRGFYDFDTNTIHLDMNKANEITVAHEAFHAVLFQKLGEANVAAAVQTMTSAIMKASPKNSMLFRRANAFAKQYAEQGATVQNEERLAELFGLMASRYETLNAPEQNAIITFLKTIAKKLGLDKFIDIGKIVTEDDTQVVELLNTLADKVATGQEIFTNDLKILKKSSPYSETGVPVAINPDAQPIKPRGRETRVYTEDRVGNYNEMTLNDFVNLHDGNVYVITSDASKLGKVEETGQILDGGFGYSLLAANMENGVGFASLDAKTANTNMNKLKKAYKTGDRVGVLIMIQTPDAMYGNMYGGEYFFDAITKLQKKNPEAYAEYSENLSNYVVEKMKGKLKKATRDAIIDPSSVTKEEFKELMDEESFDRRRNFITGVIPARNGMRMDKNAPWKKAFSDINVNTQEFTLRYGDQALLGKKFLKENKGGFLVGGFTYVVPKNTKELVDGIQDKGFTHPFFQGKVPAEPNTAVMLDGLYDINTTLQQYMPETLMVQESQKEETSRRVREQYPDDRFYLNKGYKKQTKKSLQTKVDKGLATENEQKALDELLKQQDSNDTTEVDVYIELKDRTYTNLTGANKTKFKENPINEDILVLGRANAGSLVAQSKPPLFETVTEEINIKPRGRETKNNKLNLQDEIQDKRRTVIRSENEADRTRKGGSIDIKGKSRYDVGRSDRVVRDDTVVQTISLSQKEAQDLEKRLGDKAVLDTEFYETNDAELFHKSITDSTKNNKYAASVFVYPVSEYENSRLFLTADGKAGLAITADGDIISVFSSGKGKGRVPQLIVTAIKEGATSLDHYDTVLTKYYADFGFVPAAKVKWNNEFAPDGWSKETFKAFNNGEPDVVAMVYDGGNRQTITERVGTFESVKPKLEKAPYVTEWNDAKALQESAKPSRGREQQEQEIFDYVTAAREDNFRDEVTKDFLVRIKKYPIKLVNRMMEVDVDLFKTLPKTFGSLTGGFNSGLRLYKRTKAFEQKLIKANKRKKVKLTEQQIADQTIEFLKKQPEYLKEGDGNYLTTKQAMLQVEFQRSVGTRTSESVQEKLTEARKQVQERKRGAKSLQKAKAAVRNFIRKSLPSDIYTRSEVMSLVRKVTNATEANIENIFDEVLEFVNVKNNTRLEKKIKDILNGKYETTVAGRKKGSKISLEMKERIERIAKDRLAPTATAEEVEAENQRLTEEFNAIDGKKNLTEGDYSRAVDIQILINLNNSLLMENNDVNKTGSLDVAATILEEMVSEGRSELKQQLEDAHKKYNDDASVAYEEVTGQKVDLNDKNEQEGIDLSNKKLLNEKRNKTKSVIKKFLNTLSTNVKKFFNETEALDGLMDLVSKLPGEMFGGRLQTMVTGRVDSSSRMYKQRMMQQEEIVAKKLEELFGKKWRNKVRALNKQEVAYVLDPNEVSQAQEAFDNDPSLKNKLNLKKVLLKNETKMSQNEMLYYYNLYKDPANRGSFEATFGKDYARIMEEIESKIDNNLKEFGDWQVNEFYPSLYSHYNETYKALYRTNMPWNRYYSGMIYRNDTQGNPVEQEPLDLLSQKSIMNTSVGTASTKARVQNNLPIRKMNSMNVMSTYLRDMEYFAAYGETIRDIHKMFNNKNVRTAIEAVHGEYVNRLINNMIGKIANNGVRNNPADRFINQMQNAFIFSRIGLNPTVMLKQLTSMITYANDIGVRNWLKYSLKTIPQMKSVFKEMSKNSVYMQDRNSQSITRVIESYSKEGMVEMVPNQYWDNYVNFIMYTTKFGDKAAIYLGGAPNYLYYKAQAKKRGLTEEQAQQEAIIKFEKDTKRTQQSMDLQDKDFYQTSGAIQRGLNMFLTTPKQYLRKEIQSTRNLYRKLKAWDRNAGKGTLGQNLRTFITYHFVAPALFQYVALGLPGLLRGKRDDDDEDMLRAMLIGNLNALFIVGEVISGTANLVQGKPYAGESVRSLAPLMQLQRLTKLAKRAMDTKDPKKKKDALEKLYVELAATPGLPAIQIHRFIKNLDKLGEGDDAGKDLLRLLNFSDYVISGPKNKKSSSSGPSVQEMNAQYYKEQERKKKQAETLSRRRRPASNRRTRPTRRRRTN